MAGVMQQMLVYVTDTQKRALQRRARRRGTSVATEVRDAIDTHLSGVNADELALLDAATRRAEADIGDMIRRLERANRKVDEILAARPRPRRSRA